MENEIRIKKNVSEQQSGELESEVLSNSELHNFRAGRSLVKLHPYKDAELGLRTK